ncbi:MAG: chitobiase/beta-hexosaminidase C-terminal domain-containing protein, partial [Oscillospiraceae bacterium]|nr:chitobiase/beta-hexosaminidase C-terminal domain-containing protein [Oscillospiraceae bacterium]
MRKIIIALFLLVGIVCGVVLYGSAASLIPDIMAPPTFDDLTPRMQNTFNYVQNNKSPHLFLSFSHEEFFYADNINVTISTDNPDASIYYTVDGSIPTIDSELFVYPLEFTAGEDVFGIVLKAIAIDGTEQGPVLTHTYFIGESINERFSTYVFS